MEQRKVMDFLRLGLSATAVLAVLGTVPMAGFAPGAAWAEGHDTHEDGGDHADDGHEPRGNRPENAGNHDDGHDEDSHDDGHESGGPGGKGGKGGSGGHDDGGSGGHDGGQGGQGGQGGSDGSRGAGGSGASGKEGKPVWAQEGIPEVELGRLNVARSPDPVIDRAFAEALASFTPDVAAFYKLDLAGMEAQLSQNWDNVQIIDSPLQNLALMRDALDGRSVLVSAGVTTENETLLAAFLGTASDKSVPVSTETALAISAILGEPLSEAEAASLAAKAERIRLAIVEGHG